MSPLSTHEEIQRRYWAGPRYRAAEHPVVAAYADPKVTFFEQAVQGAGRSVLDVGCGNGIFTVRWARTGRAVIGLDLSSHMLALNRHALRVQGSALALPFRDRSFDVVFEANLLHHVDQPAAAVRELARCSSRHLLLIEPNRWNPVMFAFGLVVKAERGTLRSSRPALARMVEDAGFRVTAASTTGMISQNNTPAFLVPWLRWFDRETALGEYVLICACRR